MMNFIKIILFLYPLTVLAQSSAKPELPLLEKGKTVLTVAMEDIGYFPFYYQENGEIKGFSVDVLNYIEAHSNYDFEFIILPWPRAVHLVAEGRVDLILTLFKTSKRKQIYHFIEPAYANEINQLFTLKDNYFEFDGQLQQLTPYSIGTIREYSYGEYFDGASYLNKLPALTEEILLKLLLGKQVDMLISNPLVFNQIIAKNKMNDQVKAIEPYISLTPVYMALTKKRKDSLVIKKTLGQLTVQLKASPVYQKLLTKYQLNFK
ncbi:substrate-binding periplasmic protein [Colwellia hornerae]|uniref:Amino acid ABC transporter substrate-binding protein n=1 Tax=Colwellia hornerae TaxID=89402 RepID=A0A5C6QRG1_9GAMM|nr:transporter substrate-binding domain-containing protein [Colwellia hornerae]TWX57722.1 amino acid ABC transporter substrate-binding protein [Colwellia hornerae]TWX62547.1 amino acid ABC transporter substrate-binding protein [Colwellia hornerae]TWX71459.1 amino acid ABC transporter substrate-binding protein [Colwellia hornerae]